MNLDMYMKTKRVNKSLLRILKTFSFIFTIILHLSKNYNMTYLHYNIFTYNVYIRLIEEYNIMSEWR